MFKKGDRVVTTDTSLGIMMYCGVHKGIIGTVAEDPVDECPAVTFDREFEITSSPACESNDFPKGTVYILNGHMEHVA